MTSSVNQFISFFQKIFYATSHTGVLYDCIKNRQTLFQGHVSIMFKYLQGRQEAELSQGTAIMPVLYEVLGGSIKRVYISVGPFTA